jgi:hypothetical protein
MPTFTSPVLENVTNSVLDFFIKGKAIDQIKQDRPLVELLESNAKTFPGGKGDISIAVRSTYQTTIQGYEQADTVTYVNPTPTKRVKYPWRELHAGITMTLSELKADGISVVDSVDGKNFSEHPKRDLVVLTGILDEKLYDMTEGFSHNFNKMLWGDGTTDPKGFLGIRAFITDDPAVGTVGGINRATAGNEWWRNLSNIATPWASATADGGFVLSQLGGELRKMRKFGGRPTKMLAGSDFIAAMEKELRANGNYTLDGFMRKGAVDGGMGDLSYQNIAITYDPSLDDLTTLVPPGAKRMYAFDPRHIYLYKMDQEWMKPHNPARPYDKYVLYRALTCTGQLVAQQLNSAGVYAIS